MGNRHRGATPGDGDQMTDPFGPANRRTRAAQAHPTGFVHQRRGKLFAASVAASLLVALGAVGPAIATPTFALASLHAKVSGSTVSVDSVVTSNGLTSVAAYGVCTRNASGASDDFPPAPTTVSAAGTAYAKTATFAVGTYSYFVCIRTSGSWTQVGAAQTFTVAPATAQPSPAPTPAVALKPAGAPKPPVSLTPTHPSTPSTTRKPSTTRTPSATRTPSSTRTPSATRTPSSTSSSSSTRSSSTTTPSSTSTRTSTRSPSSTPAPPSSTTGGARAAAAPPAPLPVLGGRSTGSMPVGNLPGWKQVFTQDFKTDVPLGSFRQSSYMKDLFPYTGGDTYGHGEYDATKVNSVSGGILDWFLHKEDGQSYVSAIVPEIPSSHWGQLYGRYSIRFRSEVVPGYKIAFLLWPDSNDWDQGEIDFPETTSLENGGNSIYANLYPVGDRSVSDSTGFTTNTPPASKSWHIATIEWAPNSLTYILDGVKLGTKTHGIPNTPMHWVWQVETAVGGPAPGSDASGHVQVDWATMYSYDPSSRSR